MKKILIPTDFTTGSLQLVEYVILNYPDSYIDIILLAGYKLPDNRITLMHFNGREQINKQLNDDFISAKKSLVHQHKKNINSISIQLFTGVNSYAFNNFLIKLNANDAIVPKEKSLCYHGKRWFDPTKYLRKNVTNIVEVPYKVSTELPQQKFSLINIFN
ncbi:hypothetical protein FF125_10605 [Aureibaculum algae]|uniref:Universal stress protein n=1 Tax=Aureibaculum algae TaxID=2584122 RepID=A0A5B7TUE5_9FLAO|nr:hypothetical protein [Aureibaculum algae]QCX38863.1 hypothetical protein FF125_10605 [Aureibaculum algae]